MRDRLFVAESLREIGALLRLRGGKPFRARAYEKAATAVESVSDAHFFPLVEAGMLAELPGIGAALASQITELVRNGSSATLTELRAEFPTAIVALTRVPSVSVERARNLHAALGVSSAEELESACVEGRVRHVRGFGPATEKKLLVSLERFRTRAEAILLHEALAISKTLVSHLAPAGAVATGAVRRCLETTDELGFVAAARGSAEDVLDRFARFPMVARIDDRSGSEIVARLTNGARAILRVVRVADGPLALLRATGPAEHVEAIEALASARGVNLERGEWASEDDIYRALDLEPVPPELRDDPSALERAHGDGFRLIEPSDVRGLVHCHTTYSDGRDDIETMARAADALGMQYLTITDHSPTAHYAGGVERERLERQWDEIARVQERVKVVLLRGTESDILGDGGLDYPDAVLERLDVVIASVHARMKMDAREMTRRLLGAMQLPVFKIWGHPLGRLLLRRDPIECDVEKILEVAAKSRVAIEINGDPYRLDLAPPWIRAARRLGLPFVVSTDAHSAAAQGHYVYAVAMARRGGLTRAEVLNTADVDSFRRAVRPASGDHATPR